MLRNVSELKNLRLAARDGEIGRAKDVYFDDRDWSVRYLIADTGNWLPKRKVLLAPNSLGKVTPDAISVNLSKKQIEGSPSISEHEPVSRKYEQIYYGYYGWPFYWTGPMAWGTEPYPAAYGYAPAYGAPAPRHKEEPPLEEPNLRSMAAITGYDLQALDGELGHVDDFIVDDERWVVRYLVADTKNWWPGKKVLISPRWISAMDWHRSAVDVNLSREAIKSAPEYNPGSPVPRDYEERLFDHYGRESYWTGHEMMHRSHLETI